MVLTNVHNDKANLSFFQQDECPNPLASLLFTNAKNAAEADN